MFTIKKKKHTRIHQYEYLKQKLTFYVCLLIICLCIDNIFLFLI